MPLFLAANTVTNLLLWVAELAGFLLLVGCVVAVRLKSFGGRSIAQWIGGALDARAARIDAQLRLAEESRAEAEQAREEARAEIARAHEEAGSIVARAEGIRGSLRDELATEAEAEKSRIIGQAKDEIEAERNRAILELRVRAADAAVDAAREVLARTLDDQTDRRIVAQALRESGSSDGAGS